MNEQVNEYKITYVHFKHPAILQRPLAVVAMVFYVPQISYVGNLIPKFMSMVFRGEVIEVIES